MDIGIHEFRILVTAGSPATVNAMMPGLADHLAAPPAAYAHLPYDSGWAPAVEPLLDVRPASIRLLACKRSWDGEALIVRLQEAVGRKTAGEMRVSLRKADQERGHVPAVHVPLSFQPFEIKTLRVERAGTSRPVRMIEEDG
jgi:alpha-mannosidase